MTVTESALVRLEHIDKSFGPVHANQDISLDIHAGRIKAILGENGAGKSTLMSILAGQLQPDKGRILLQGKPAHFTSAKGAIREGVGMVYQHFMLVDAMTVAENVLMGQGTRLWINPGKMELTVAKLAQDYGLEIDPGTRVSSLSMGERQRVEILKLLQRQSQVLIFDEPTAVLTPPEAEQLFNALRKMAQQGKAILFISHKLEEVLSLADDIAILRKGKIVDEMSIDQVTSKAELARRMVGREVLLEVMRPAVEIRQRVLRITNLVSDPLEKVSFDVRQGEIVAVVGVAGNGQKALAETICGLKRPQSGKVTIFGQGWSRYYSRGGNRQEVLSYIPEDRRGLATCMGLDLTENFLLTTCNRFSAGPWLRKQKAASKTAELVEKFDIQPPDIRVLARQLSGGNLQKLVLAREFFRSPRLIVAEQPTQGLDVAATEEVWKILLNARKRAGILLITGDLNEALTLSDRIAVIFSGRIMDLFSVHNHKKVEQIGLMMAGLDQQAQ
jgi:simple sugar transport system ATP-binding protein